MSFRNWFGPVVASGFLTVVAAVVGGGCSSSASSGPTPGDASSDVVIRKTLDGSGLLGDDSGDGSDGSADGTTGKICAADKDCVSPTGPGINQCSSNFPGTVGNVNIQFWSTPVCIVPPTMACDPAPLGQQLGPHYCDGPDVIDSPGICVPFDAQNPQPGQGLCYPKCTYTVGGAATGCAGSNVCNLDWFFAPTAGSNAVTGVGFCGSVCQVDSDCSSLGVGYVCQTDIGLCTTKKVTRPKAVGASCFSASDGGADDNTTGACNCLSGTSGSGICTSSCVVGGTACPDGWVCETDETSNPFPTSTVTTQTRGVAGFCVQPCSLTDAGSPVDSGGTPEASAADDAGGDGGAEGGVDAGPANPPDAGAGGTCPPATTCKAGTLAGPDCQP